MARGLDNRRVQAVLPHGSHNLTGRVRAENVSLFILRKCSPFKMKCSERETGMNVLSTAIIWKRPIAVRKWQNHLLQRFLLLRGGRNKK